MSETKSHWLPVLTRSAMPRYLQIVEAMEQAIAGGQLRSGDRLPPQRTLARALNVDLTTVTRAYQEATQRELMVARGVRGSFVAAQRLELGQVVDLSMNIPPVPREVVMEDLLRESFAQLMLRIDADVLMTYHAGGGSEADRTAAVQWLAPMLGPLQPDRIVVSAGAQAALAALLLSLGDRHQPVFADALSYPGLGDLARQFGRPLVALDSDEEGVLPDSLAAACAQHGRGLLYANLTLHNPTTRTASLARREALVRVIRHHGLQVIEDDPYWRLLDDAPPPLARLLPESVHYVASFSKCLAPGLRLAYVVPALGDDGARFKAATRSLMLMPPALMAALVSFWIGNGTAGRLLQGIRQEAEARQTLARRILAPAPGTPPQSLHLWYPLPSGWTAEALVRRAKADGLAIASSADFMLRQCTADHVRLSLGALRTREQLADALRRLDRLLHGPHPGGAIN